MTKHNQNIAKSWKKPCANSTLPSRHTPTASSIDIIISGTVFLKQQHTEGIQQSELSQFIYTMIVYSELHIHQHYNKYDIKILQK